MWTMNPLFTRFLRLAGLLAAFTLTSSAWGGTKEDLLQASDPDLPEAARLAAFDRVVSAGGVSLQVVLQIAGDDQGDTRQRWVAVRSLGKIGGPHATELLIRLTTNPEPAIRAAAAQALGDLGDRRHAPVVVELLKDPAIIVRAAASEALCRVGDDVAVDALSAALLDKSNYYRGSSTWVRRHYVEALGCMARRSAVPALLRSLDDADPAVESAALRAFEKVAGFSYAEGRTTQEQEEAWRRWAANQLR